MSATAALADARERELICTDLDSSLIVEAAAGTGKTTELVNRIVALIASGRGTLDRIVAVTFTEKAAGELKLRIRSAIELARRKAGAETRAYQLLTDSLRHLEEARVGTIHSFCADLLREHPVEACVDPRFEVAPTDRARGIFERAFDLWFERTLETPGPGVRRVLRRRDLEDNSSPREILRNAAWQLCEWRDFDQPWRHAEFDRDGEIDALMAELEALGALAGEGFEEDPLCKSLHEVEVFVREMRRLEDVRNRDHDALEAELVKLARARHWQWRGFRRSEYGDRARAEVHQQRDATREHLMQFRERAGAHLAPLLRDELWELVTAYQEAKRRAGKLDFMDLLLRLRDLIRDNPAIRKELQTRFSHVFIDEFQDTDPLQAEILLLLAADDPAENDWRKTRPRAGKIFIVGDPKQSIYRFRRADVSLYQEIKQNLLDSGRARLLYLSVSFRSVPALQTLVNAAFAPLMTGAPSQAEYAPLNPWRAELPGQPAVVALPVPAPYGDYGKVVKWKIDESLPEALGAFVDWLVKHSGWKVTERERAETVALQPHHICILFRRFVAFRRDVTRPYVKALESRRIPHVLVGGSSFHEREEIAAMRALLAAIERPDDELSVFATLHGPIFALSDNALLSFRHQFKLLHPFRIPQVELEPELREVADALEILRELHRGRNHRSIADTIARLLEQTRAHAGFAIWPTGEQALANINRLIDQARRFELRGEGISFRAFVDELEADAESGLAGDAPIVEEGTRGVRLMTVHAAKGLEFPVVILADLTRNETATEAQQHVDQSRRLSAFRLAGCAPPELLEAAQEELRRDAEEAARVLYVAVTRARDLLVAPVVGDEPQEGWLGKLNPVLYPSREAWRTPLAREGGGLAFDDDSVLLRPERTSKQASVCPGLHQPQRGAHRVLWWDPKKLELDVAETVGLRQEKLLAIDEGGKVSQSGIDAHDKWCATRNQMIATGSLPMLNIATATELASAEGIISDVADASAPAAIELVTSRRATARPHGSRFGTLVHAVMLTVSFDAGHDEIGQAALFHGRLLGCTPEEIAAATIAVADALKTAPIARARASGEAVRRECPVLLRLESADAKNRADLLVEGIADLVFAENENGQRIWTVVDFKTDLDIRGRQQEYHRQIGLYVKGISQATGEPARGLILWI